MYTWPHFESEGFWNSEVKAKSDNHITFIFIKMMSHDLVVKMAYSELRRSRRLLSAEADVVK